MKEFFKNHKKGIVINVCAIVLIALVAIITMFATTSFAESSAIGKENAQNFAFVDAGIDPLEAQKIKTEFEFKNGQFIYDVEFVSNGTEYEYWVKASDGSIIKKEIDASDEIIKQKEDNNKKQENEVNKEQTTNNEEKNNVENDNNNNTQSEETKKNENTQKESTKTSSSNQISLETAKSKALSNAGVSASECTFTKAKLDRDDGKTIYEIEFYKDGMEYSYDIDALTGKILKHEKEYDD